MVLFQSPFPFQFLSHPCPPLRQSTLRNFEAVWSEPLAAPMPRWCVGPLLHALPDLAERGGVGTLLVNEA